MLITLLTWIYQLFIILPFGLFLYTLKPREDGSKKIDTSGFILIFLLGLTVVTTLSAILSLVTNIGWQVHLGFLLAAVLLWVFLSVKKRIPRFTPSLQTMNWVEKSTLGIAALAAGAVLVLATTVPENPDTAIYHAQAIHWIEDFGAVPGLANLHQRFGYNSNWLVANALFSLAFLKIQSFHLLPSTLFLVMTAYFFSGLFALAGGSRKISDLAKAFFFIAAFLLLAEEISSPGTDMPATLLTWFVVSEWIRLIEEPRTGDEKIGLWLSLVCVFCATLKLSSVPILIFVIWFLAREINRKRAIVLLPIIMAGILIAGSYVSRNIIISGHLFFPGFSFDPIQLEWSLPLEQVQKEKEVIHWFGLLPRRPFAEFRQMEWQQQYSRWLVNQVPRHIAMLSFISLTTLMLIGLLLVKRGRKWLNQYREFAGLLLTLYAGVIFWLVSAPAFRFGYGFILSLIVLMGTPLIIALERFSKSKPFLLNSLVIAVSFFVILNAFVDYSHPGSLQTRLLQPAAYPVWKTEECQFGNFTIRCQTQYDSCWYTPFPCALQGDPNVFMRGEDFDQGFMVKPE